MVQVKEILKSYDTAIFGYFNNDNLLDLVVQDADILNNARYYQFDGESFISVGLILFFAKI